MDAEIRSGSTVGSNLANMIHEDTFKSVDFHGAKGLVFFGDKLLVYRRDDKTSDYPGYIDLPGGGREGLESPWQTFQREIKEEFGLDIKHNDIHFSCTIPSELAPDRKSFFLVAKLPAQRARDIVLGNEGLGWRLLTPQEFISHPDGISRQQQRVEAYINGQLRSV